MTITTRTGFKIPGFIFAALATLLLPVVTTIAQDGPVAPVHVINGRFLGESPPLRDIAPMTDEEWEALNEKAAKKALNPKMKYRAYPYYETALPKGPDPVWQRAMGASRDSRAPLQNFAGGQGNYLPLDPNGTIGPNHYMQTVNTVYTIYDRGGNIMAGPTALNTLFYGLAGSTYNDGDPIVLYDEQADRWLMAVFSITGSNDYMLIAVSTTNDPTGTWYKYSFDVYDTPDYEKFGIWRDGYYMGTNTIGNPDIYVFNRSAMLAGQPPIGIAFDNAWRPGPSTSFNCVPPIDNDGAPAPEGEPGLFVALNDDGVGGGSDELWILELDVDWQTPANSTLSRVQQIAVASFDSNFGATMANIAQPGTTVKLDAIPQMVMNPPQYRNFGTYETIVCCHTVDVDQTDHGGIRWYELRRTGGGNWTIRQQGTYAPDGNSRFMGSIMLNGSGELALGYSISSSSVYPGIRYTGQSSTAYSAGNSTLDVAEDIIQTGTLSQTNSVRWGDYSSMQVDPADDETFWFTSQYLMSSTTRTTRIASLQIGPVQLTANFYASNTTPQIFGTVTLTDVSFGSPTGWSWSISPGTFYYVNGTTSSSQNPQVQFIEPGPYTVSLTVSAGSSNETMTKNGYIQVLECESFTLPFTEDFSDGNLPPCWKIQDNMGLGQVWMFTNPLNRTVNTTTSANGFAIMDSEYYGTGNHQNTALISPLLDLSAYTTVNLYFQYYFLAATGSYGQLHYTINDGATWTQLGSNISSTSATNPAAANLNLTTQCAGQSRVRFRWSYVGTYGEFFAVDDISVTGTGPTFWTGTTSSDWTLGSNWSTGTAPSGTSNVIIPVTAANWPVFTGDFNVGTTCDKISFYGDGQLTVNGNVIISSGKTLAFYGEGTINLSGNWINNGNFIPGKGTVKFTGSIPSSVIPATTATASILNYTLSAFPKGMTELSGSTITVLADDGGTTISIPFSFNYLNNPYSQIYICSNGWASFNTTNPGTSNVNGRLFSGQQPNLTLAPWWDDLNDDATAVISYVTTGNTPYRVFSVEWKSIATYASGATSRISFQVKLFETTNIIEFHYGNLVPGTYSGSESASIGIEDGSGGSAHFIDATTGSTSTGVSTLKAQNNWPAVNYRFSPSSITKPLHSVTVEKTGGAYLDLIAPQSLGGDLTVTSGSVSGPGAANAELIVKGHFINNGSYVAGKGRIVMNGSALQNLGGSAPSTFNQLTVNNPAGVALLVNETVKGTLTMSSGNIDCGAATLELGTSVTDTGTLVRTAGNILGSFKRWVAAGRTNALYFPVGTAVSSHQARVQFTNNTAGTLTASFEPGDPGGHSGFPLTESGQTINASDLYTEGSWTLVSGSGLGSTAYSLQLTATGFNAVGPPDAETRILKRPDGGGPWSLQGTHVAAVPPVARRSELNGFSRFILAKPCNDAATVSAGGPDAVCQSATPGPLTLAGALFGGTATTAAWSILSLSPDNGGINGTLSSTGQTADPSSITYTPPANYSGTVTLALTSNDPPGSCPPASATRTIDITPGRKISGSINYYNTALTPITSGVTVKLFQNGSQVGTDYTVSSGTFEFNDICPGTYELRLSSSNPTAGSVNTIDAAQANYWGAVPWEIEKVRFHAGDVTGPTFYINATDAQRIQANFVNGLAFDKGDWAFWKAGETIAANTNPTQAYPTVTLGASNLTANIYALCAGDFNRSFAPGQRAGQSHDVMILPTGVIKATGSEQVNLPLILQDDAVVGAVALVLNYPAGNADITGVRMHAEGGTLNWSANNGELRIGWMTLNPVTFKAGDTLLTIAVQSHQPPEACEFRVETAGNPLNQIADGQYEVIPEAVLLAPVIVVTPTGMEEPEKTDQIRLGCSPNPFINRFSLNYFLPQNQYVVLEIRDMAGKRLRLLEEGFRSAGHHSSSYEANGLPAGVLSITLKTGGEQRSVMIIRKTN